MATLRRVLVALALTVIVLYGGAVVWLMTHETTLVFEAKPALGGLRPKAPFEPIAIRGRTGLRELIWLMPAPVRAGDAPWVIFLHGNDSNVSSRMNLLHCEQLRAIGMNVAAAEYRGYGGVEGVPTEAGLEADARSAYDYLRDTRHVDPHRIVIYGWSLGSAVAVDLASRVDTAAVILEGAPASVVAIGQARYPMFPIRLLIRNPFESILKIGGVKSPMLFLHSPEDAVIPIAEGRRLFDAAHQPKEWVEVRGGHVYASEKDPAFFGHVRRFLIERGMLRGQSSVDSGQ
jgi:fermentation-respiration switch protein FrsA (DUF1100 family)